MIIPLPKTQGQTPVPAQASFLGAGKVTQSSINMSGVQAPQAVQVDSRIATWDAAPLAAFGQLGQDIAGKLHQVQMERYEAQNRVDIADARLAMDQALAQFENDKLTNNYDPRDWGKLWQERSDKIHAQFEADERYSPVAREALNLELKDWRGQTAIRINTDATKATFQRARESDNAQYISLVDSGQYNKARTHVESSPYFSADDKVNLHLQIRDKEKEVEEQAIIDTEISVMSTDPRKWLEEKKDYKPQNAKEMQRMEWLKNRAQATIHDQTTEASDRILNALATAQGTGKVLVDEDIDKLANGALSPYALSKLKSDNAAMQNASEKARRAAPEYQREMMGRVDAAIRDFDPNATDSDDELFDILGGIAQLGEGVAPEMRKRLEAKRKPEPADDTIHDIAEERMKALLYDKEKFSTTHKIGTYLADGLLRDEIKLQLGGLNYKEANEVAKIASQNEEKAIDLYKKYSSQEGRTITVLDKTTRDAFTALKYGESTWKTTDEKGESEAAFRYGSALKSYREWSKQHPNASDKEASAKLSEIIGAKTSVNMVPKLPGGRDVSYSAPPALPGAYKREASIPYVKGGPAANVRYNNPAAAWPRKADEKYGLIGYGKLNDGEGNKIGRFPTPVHGAAANFDLFASNYTGMTAQAAMTKWRGRPSPVPKGYDPGEVIDEKFLQDPDRAIDFFKKMALHESPTFNSMTDDDWHSAWRMWQAGGDNKATAKR
jgi:hypothetical protein